MPCFPNRQCFPALLCAVLTTTVHATDFDLTPTAPTDQAYQVEVELKVGGDLTVRDMDASAAADAAPKRLPMSVEGRLVYQEQRLSPQQVARYYSQAQATIKVDKGGKSPRLTDDRRLVVGELDGGARIVLRSPEGPLTREELDLIDIVGGSPLLDRLMPGEKLAEGESWQVDADVMGPLLGLDSVSVCEVSNVVDEGNASFVKFQVAGTVHGEVEGAKTEFDLRGLGLYSFREGCVTRLNLAVKEKRELGPATPGFEGVAKANIKRTPLNKTDGLSAERLARVTEAAAPPADLLLESRDLGLRVLHDRQWFIAAETRRSVSLRRVDNGGLVAQATFTRVPSKKPENQPTLDQFESEVTASLGDGLADVVSSEQWTSQTGCRCLGVVVRGKVQDLELEQRHYLVMPAEEGHSIAIAASLAVSDMATVGNADRLLADTLELLVEKEKSEVARQSGDSVAK